MAKSGPKPTAAKLRTFGPAPGDVTFSEQNRERTTKAKKRVRKEAAKLPANRNLGQVLTKTIEDPTPAQRRYLRDRGITIKTARDKKLKTYEIVVKDKPKKKSILGEIFDAPASVADALGPLGRADRIRLGALKAVKNLAQATYEAPSDVVVNTGKGLRDIALGLPAALAAAATTRPDKTVGAIVDDYERRYGQSSKEQRERFKKEGAAGELLDATLAAGGQGVALGRGLSKTAAKGGLGPRAQAVAAAPRPALRVSGGKAVPQAKSKNYFGAELQVRKDAKLAKRQEKKVTKAVLRDDGAPLLPAIAVKANKDAGRLVEVVPKYGITAKKAQRVKASQLKGAAVSRRNSEGLRIIDKGARPVINRLSKHERRGLAYALEGRVTTGNSAKATEQLTKIRAGIVKERTAKGLPLKMPRGRLRKTDELRVIDDLLANVDKAFTPKLGEAIEKLRPDSLRVGRADPRLTAEQRLVRRYAPQAEDLGITRGAPKVQREKGALGELYRPDETTSQWVRRVQEAAAKEGLSRPLYFPGEKYALADAPNRAAYAPGGSKATRPDFKWTGDLARAGRRDVSPEAYITGLAKNIKATRNWELIRDTVEAGTFEGLRNMKLGELRDALAKANIREGDVRFWNPGLYADAMEGRGRSYPLKSVKKEGDELAAARLEGDELGAASAHDALLASTVKSLDDAAVKTSSGWSAIPKAYYDEIMESTKPSGALGRSYDIVKSKQSRVLLGTLNIPWLTFQGVSNTGIGMLATGGRLPQALIKQRGWYKSLKPIERDTVDTLAGQAASTMDAGLTRMGAAADNFLVNGYRALKSNPIWDRPLVAGRGPSTRQLNPIEAMFRLDRAQNTMFRRAVLYDSLKREAFKDMGRNVLDVRAAQAPVIEAMSKKLRNPAAVERHAKHLDDWLGNWTTFTAFERKVANRAIMFYPFMRYSLKLAFHTLPAKHPLGYALAGKLSAMQQEELKRLGVDGLPWGKGRLYFTRGGELQQIDLGRANPVANSLLSMNEPSQVFGMTTPLVGMAIDQFTHRSNFKDKGWLVNGENFAGNKKGSDYGHILGALVPGKTRNRILMDDLLSLAYPYREAKKQLLLGPQGDDSTLLAPRPTKYKRDDMVKSIKESIEREKEDRSLLKSVFPLLGSSAEGDVETALRMKEQAKEKKPKAKKKRPKYGVSGGSGSRLDGGKLNNDRLSGGKFN